ncbi:MAG: hypothetical protein GYB64_11815 [Chloroflexi bacterium]|nr:hypothetical protein [Chloroflexota bacterium]
MDLVSLQGDRMNTVFKYWLQVWFLLALAAGIAAAALWNRVPAWVGIVRVPWQIVLVLLVTLAVLYPVTATGAKMQDRWAQDAPITLDGLAYMPYAERSEEGQTFSVAGDYYAVHWLRQSVEGTPVLLEAHTSEYRWGNRIANYTGYPAIVGWNWHQRQQRPTMTEQVWARVGDITTAYNSPFMDDALEVFARYDVDLVVVGGLERALYSPAGISKFQQMAALGQLTLIYDYQGTQIYRVEKEMLP